LTTLKTKSDLPAEAKHLERELSRLMGTKVRLTGAERGELRVKYSSAEDLNRVLEVMGYNNQG
jgi:ParB family transcriptional regulator, chromosome partitioning protein